MEELALVYQKIRSRSQVVTSSFQQRSGAADWLDKMAGILAHVIRDDQSDPCCWTLISWDIVLHILWNSDAVLGG